jgi:hypothetical protein
MNQVQEEYTDCFQECSLQELAHTICDPVVPLLVAFHDLCTRGGTRGWVFYTPLS